MSRKMLINATHPEEHRVAIVEDGNLVELDIEITGKEQTRGNIYKGVVVRVETGLQAAFIDFGGERPGFLQIGEIHPSFFKTQNGENRGRPRINDLLRRGQELLVQVVKEERGTKGAALTTYLSLPGRFMVLMPESETKGVSRKIEQESQRKKLKEAMASLELPINIGYIVRTAGIGQKKTELKRDVDYLIRVYEKILDLGSKVKAPALIYKESNLVIRSIRDYFSSDIDEVLVDDPAVAREAKEFFEIVMPEYAKLVKLHQERRPIFSRYQIEEQIENITRNKVSLPSGGSIVIDSTEALVAVDVNSGKLATEQGVEATAFKTNMEAAVEVARQLRLRDLGGLIVIDFIDMRDRKHIRDVEKCLKDALKIDKARVTVGRISQFGLLEMSRQRIKSVLAAASYLPCPHCEGTGRIKSAESQALDFLRRIYTGMAKGQISQVDAEIPLEVSSYLLNQKRAELLELERHYDAVIHIKGRPDFIAGQMEINFIKREKDHQVTAQQYIDAAAARAETPEQAEPETTVQATEDKPAEAAPREEVGRKRRRPRRRRKSTMEEAEKESAATSEESNVPAPGEESEIPCGDDLLELLRSGRSSVTPVEMPAEPAAAGTSVMREESPTTGQAAEESEISREEKGLTAEVADSDADEKVGETSPGTIQEGGKPHRKPRRRRKPASQVRLSSTPSDKVEPSAIPAGEGEKPAEQPVPAGLKDEPNKPVRKPRKRPKASSPKTGDQEQPALPQPASHAAQSAPAESTEKSPAPETMTPGEKAEEKRPSRPRRPRRPARTAKAESVGESGSEIAARDKHSEPAQTEKKPARRPRKKTGTRQAVAAVTESVPEKNTEN
ncbi:MAG: Rne/Rng family ribonuclease [Syntrophotaleaceae bacterium]